MSKITTPQVRLITTQDGSSSLYLNLLDETYHSTKGAVGESIHIYINNGVKTITPTRVSLFEVGFGTGLNTLLTYRFAKGNDLIVNYHTLEPFPISEEIALRLGYPNDPYEETLFFQMHKIVDGRFDLDKNFSFFKYNKTLENFDASFRFDIIYFDAFAPSKQPDIWSRSNLSKCFDLLHHGGIMVTYCAQGQFKRDLASIGFEVEVLPGALGKKEMVRARKPGKVAQD